MFKRALAAVALCLALASEPAAAQDAATVERTPTPAWVTPLAKPAAEPPVDQAPIRMLALDQQIRFDADGSHDYILRRMRIQNRQGLGMVSTVSAVWNPPRERLEVHAIRIIRGDQVIDALEGQSFDTLRRENNLEDSMLDGSLTATLQPRDLRVGDILETEFTIHDTGGVLAPHHEALTGAGSGLTLDRYRLRASWPADLPMRASATEPWADMRARRQGQDWVFEVQADGLAPQHLPEDLPARYGMTRIGQFSDFETWGAASILMAPLYVRASTLEEGASLKAEIERIRSTHATDEARTLAALRFVQDNIRYVALSMGEGGYVPTPAEEVWRSRFGDCKGKTVLLLAILRDLGIEAEAALVSTRLGDGLDERMPMMSWFDHVIVRAVVDGRVYWLDGTRTGDRGLSDLTPPPYHWALPVRQAGADLERLELAPPETPTMVMTLDVDASKGLDADADFTIDVAYFGDAATSIRQSISAIPRDQLQTMMLSNIDEDTSSTRVSSVDTRYDDDTNAFHMILTGTDRMSWVGGGAGGRATALSETELGIPYVEERRGLFESYKDEPHVLTHPYMTRTVTRIKLPDEGRGFRLEGGDQTLEGGGYRMERRGTLKDGVAEVVVTMTSLVPELTAAQMAEARTRAESLTPTTMRLRAPADYAATEADRARTDPGDSDGDDLIERAGRLVGVGDRDGALALLDAAIVRDPANGEALRTRGSVRLDAQDFAGARADYDAAVDLDPADSEAAIGQGLVALRDGRPNDAVVSFSVGLRLAPESLTALSGRGAAYHRIGRNDRALADYRALATASPGSATALLGELRALRRLGRVEEARTRISAKLAEEATNVVALGALVDLNREAGRPGDSLGALDAALAETPDDIGLLSLRGSTRAAAGDEAGARADYEAFRTLTHGDPALLNNLCWSQAVAGFDLDRALSDCDRAVDAGEAAFIDSRAMVLLQLGRIEEAKADYDRALAEAPNQATSLYGRGLTRLALNDEGGRQDIERARALNVDVAEEFQVFHERRPDLRP